MPHTTDPVLVALIAVLESKALKKGKTSILTQLVSRLDEATATSLTASVNGLKSKKMASMAKPVSSNKAKLNAGVQSKSNLSKKKAKSKSDTLETEPVSAA